MLCVDTLLKLNLIPRETEAAGEGRAVGAAVRHLWQDGQPVAGPEDQRHPTRFTAGEGTERSDCPRAPRDNGGGD